MTKNSVLEANQVEIRKEFEEQGIGKISVDNMAFLDLCAEKIWRAAIQEAIKVLPEVADSGDDVWDYYNRCRQEALQALENLKA